MNPWIGWALAVLAFAVGWRAWGWQGLLLAASVVTFWLLLQFTRITRVMRRAAERPLGEVDSAVMLNARLQAGMTLLEVMKLTGSLGRKIADAPETFAWSDAGGAQVQAEFERGRCRRWTLMRGGDAPAPAIEAAEPAPPN